MICCPHCQNCDIALQDSTELSNEITCSYLFKVWICEFFCHQCGKNFSQELDDDERKEYL